MDRAWSEEKVKIRRDKSREAIALALEGKWERATEVNRGILRLFPDDVDALNRLGKAFFELGRYSEATASFESATRIAPHNTIAKKNLGRLAHLRETSPAPAKQGRVVTPYLFIEESGKSGVTVLRNPAPREVLVIMAAGDAVKLECSDHGLLVKNNEDEVLGRVEPKMGTRLSRLMGCGNRYEAAIISIDGQDISVIMSETYRDHSVGDTCSFPTRSKEDYRVYWKDARFRYDIDSELEEEEEFVSRSIGSSSDGGGFSDEEELSESINGRKTAAASGDDEEE